MARTKKLPKTHPKVLNLAGRSATAAIDPCGGVKFQAAIDPAGGVAGGKNQYVAKAVDKKDSSGDRL